MLYGGHWQEQLRTVSDKNMDVLKMEQLNSNISSSSTEKNSRINWL